MTTPAAPPPRGGSRVGIVEGWELRHAQKQEANAGAWKGLVFVLGLLVVLVVGGWMLARPVLGPAIIGLFEDNPSIIRLPIVTEVLAAELADRVKAPAGTDDTNIRFVVEQGQTIDQIREGLIDQGLITDSLAFQYEIIKDDKDQLIVAGQYTMTALMSPAQVVEQLAGSPDPPTPKTALHIRGGWRIEQIVAYLQQEKGEAGLEMNVKDFRDLALEPSRDLRDDYPALKQIPRGNSLEGFLAWGTYPVDIDISAEEFLHVLLGEWQDRNGDLVAQARRAEVDFYQALTIASLVERETPRNDERARVAGVYWNRLDRKVNTQTGLKMQADPTVVYAADTLKLKDMGVGKWDEYVFWDTLGVQLVTVDVPDHLSSFQTYQNKGLPDWPIASPSRESIEAAISPSAKKGFLYFVSCPGENSHTFAKTRAKHNKNVRKCELPV